MLKSQNKIIAFNSLFLYIKLFVTTLIGLFTSRIVLLQLGADDYGLYVVIGGVVTMMNFLGTMLITTTTRFITIELSKKLSNVNKIFNASLIIHMLFAVFLVLIGETLGLWYIKNYLNVSPEKISDAIFVLHFVIGASFFSVLTIPFQGLLTAYENFFIRAVFEIVKSIFTLLLIVLLIYIVGNKLRAYSVFMFLAMILPLILYVIYSKIKYHSDVKIKFVWDKNLYKRIFSFSWWIMFGTIAHIGERQGAAIIINLFFGTVVNAAFGIASQVNNYVMMFVTNLNQAAVPQIMKSHSSGNTERSLNLVYNMPKYGFFLLLLLSIPIIFSIDQIMVWWLKEVPKYSKEFVVLMLINGLIGVLSSSFGAIIQALGDIRKWQVWYSVITLFALPVAFIFFKMNAPPYSITIVTIGSTFTVFIVRLILLKQKTNFCISIYLKKTLLPIGIVSISIIPQFFLRPLFNNTFPGVVVFSIISVALIIITIYYGGLNKNEKLSIINNISKVKRKITKYDWP